MRRDYPAAFIRGGTSKALIFHERDLPRSQSARDAIFLRAMGSPDPYGRQLDGMGGGQSSLSKVCVVGCPTHPEADVDYAFAQVQVDRAIVDHSGNCGNMSSAIGPFAIDEGLIFRPDGEATVRIHNVNTGKLIHATFQVRDGRSEREGDYRIQGVPGSGSPVRLDFLDPGGAGTGRLLPGNSVTETLVTMGGDAVLASLVDAANPVVFLDASELGLTATESPQELDSDLALRQRLEALRCAAAVRMGLASTEAEASARRMTPFVAIVAGPAGYRTLSAEQVDAQHCDLAVRFLSNGSAHRALPLTGALCTAVAAQLPGSVVHRHRSGAGSTVRLGSPSGVLEVGALVAAGKGGWQAVHATATRTTRRLFTGMVAV